MSSAAMHCTRSQTATDALFFTPPLLSDPVNQSPLAVAVVRSQSDVWAPLWVSTRFFEQLTKEDGVHQQPLCAPPESAESGAVERYHNRALTTAVDDQARRTRC